MPSPSLHPYLAGYTRHHTAHSLRVHLVHSAVVLTRKGYLFTNREVGATLASFLVNSTGRRQGTTTRRMVFLRSNLIFACGWVARTHQGYAKIMIFACGCLPARENKNPKKNKISKKKRKLWDGGATAPSSSSSSSSSSAKDATGLRAPLCWI